MSIENYECLGLLGSGSFAKVFQVRKKNGDDADKIYALKTIKFTDSKTELITTEKNILSRVDHTFVVRLIDAFENKNTFYFVLEYVSGGTLADLLQRTEKLEPSAVSFYMKEMVVGLEYLHSEDIIHGDIKPSNILLDATGHIKITDFGISIELFSDYQKFHNFSVDWNSLGAVFYNMITGTILVHRNKWPKTLSKKAGDLLQKLLKTYPKKSLECTEAKDIKDCKYFKNTCWDEVILRLESPPFIPLISSECCVCIADFCNCSF